MTTIRVEFTVEDYIVEDWCLDNGIPDDEFEGNIMSFADEYLGLTIDDAVVL